MKKDDIVIPLHDNGSTSIPRLEYDSKVKELGSETKAMQHFLKKVYSTS